MSEVKEQANIFGSTEDLTWSLKDVRYVAQMLLNTANDLGLSEMKIGTLFLQAILDVTSDTWLPIDYSQSESGKGCFDGEAYQLLCGDSVLVGRYMQYTISRSQRAGDACKPLGGDFFADIPVSLTDYYGGSFIAKPTHYRPIPAGWRR